MPSGDLFAPEASSKAHSEGATVFAHCDGGARGNPGPAGYGAVVTAKDGTVLAELSEFLGFKTNNFAEYSGLLGVLQWALNNGHTRLEVVSDSLLMVNQVQGRYKVNSPDLKPLHEEAKRRIGKLGSFKISHALRDKNKAADRLANEAMDRGTNRQPAPSASSPAPLRSNPYPVKATEPPTPRQIDPRPAAGSRSAESIRPPSVQPGEMLRGFVKDGVVVLLGGRSLPEGTFVKVVRE